MSSTNDSQSRAQQLRALAEWLAEHPAANPGTIIGYSGGATVYQGVNGEDAADAMTRFARELGGRWTKTITVMDDFALEQEILPGVTYRLYTARENVCERVVVATEEVEVEEPDPEAVAALPKVKRTETVEKVEWVCPPSLLAGSEVAA